MQHTKMQTVITFLVILELMKMGKIAIEQAGLFEDIEITWQPGADEVIGRTFESSDFA